MWRDVQFGEAVIIALGRGDASANKMGDTEPRKTFSTLGYE
jgi:hypothetical protein